MKKKENNQHGRPDDAAVEITPEQAGKILYDDLVEKISVAKRQGKDVLVWNKTDTRDPDLFTPAMKECHKVMVEYGIDIFFSEPLEEDGKTLYNIHIPIS